MTFEELFQRLLELDEHDTIEAKRASDVGKSVLETISAFCNEPGMGGGHLLLGVVKDETSFFPTYRVEGLVDPDKLQMDISSQLQSCFNVRVRAAIKVDTHDGERVIVVEVPEANPADKPVFIKKKGKLAGSFRRSGSTDVQCTEDDLLLFLDARSRETHDGRVMEDTTWDDVDPAAVADYRTFLAEGNSSPHALGWSDRELLESLHCAKKIGGDHRLTMAGLLLFGTVQAQRRLIPLTRVDYIRIPGKEWVQEPDREFLTTERRGPLIRLAEQIRHDILDDLPRAFTIPGNSLQREEKPLIPGRVIREAVINALMHRDYRVNSPVQILRYSNRLEFRNPGYSLKSEELLGKPVSVARNPWIAEVLHETRFAETKGRGISIMREQMQSVGLSLPTFESDRSANCFTLILLFHHLLGSGDVAWLAGFHMHDLTPDDCQALVYARELGAIDNKALRNLSGMETLAASRSLRRLRDEGLLEQKGKGSATYYVPTRYLTTGQGEGSGKPGEVAAKHMEVDAIPSEVGPKSGEVGRKPDEVDEKSREAQVPEAEDEASLEEAWGSVGERLKTLPKHLGRVPDPILLKVEGLGRNARREKLRAVILDLCGWKSLRAEEIARILGRNQSYLVANQLGPMIAQGLLEYTYPEEPHHMRQAYRVPKVK